MGHRCSEEILVSAGQEANWATDTLKRFWYPQDGKPSVPRDLGIHRTGDQVGHRCSEEILVFIGQEAYWATDTLMGFSYPQDGKPSGPQVQ
jgi:hypothetical protein